MNCTLFLSSDNFGHVKYKVKRASFKYSKLELKWQNYFKSNNKMIGFK